MPPASLAAQYEMYIRAHIEYFLTNCRSRDFCRNWERRQEHIKSDTLDFCCSY